MAFRLMRLSAEQKAAREQEARARSSKLLLDDLRFQEYLNGATGDLELPLDLNDLIIQESAPLIPVEEPLIPVIPENGEEPKFPDGSEAKEFLIPQVPTAEELARKKRDRSYLRESYENCVVLWVTNTSERNRRFVGGALSAICCRLGFVNGRRWARMVRDRIVKKMLADGVINQQRAEYCLSKKMSSFFE